MSETNSILVIDDDSKFSFGLVAVLRRAGFHVLAAPNGREGLAIIREERPQLILCDMMMPPPNGIQLKKELSEDPSTAQIPFLFLTARTSQVDKLAGLESGADDYITKPVDSNELLARVQAVLRRDRLSYERGIQDTTLNKDTMNLENIALKHDVETDPLTGAMNRRALDTISVESYSLVVVIDLDHFKEINDQFGHIFGDQILVEFTRICQFSLRRTDRVIRWGGDEFILLLNNLVTKSDCYPEVERLLFRIHDQYNATFPKLNLTFSFGIACLDESISEAVKLADIRMFQMKKEKKRA